MFGVGLGLGWWAIGPPWLDHGHPRSLLYSGLVVVAAFLIAAMVQRVIMGKYAIKAGVFEVGALEDTADATAALDRRVTALETRQAPLCEPSWTVFGISEALPKTITT